MPLKVLEIYISLTVTLTLKLNSPKIIDVGETDVWVFTDVASTTPYVVYCSLLSHTIATNAAATAYV